MAMQLTMPTTTASPKVRVAVVQAEPAWLDLTSSILKTNALITDAASGGASLIAFPECFIPGYPAWIWSRAVDPKLTIEYIKNSLRLSSLEMASIRATAVAHNINVVLGFSENDGDSLYMSQVIIEGASGEIVMHRRKIKPTHVERTIFGDGSGKSLKNVVNLNIGKTGALQCWEHIQPLLKYHTYLQREAIHVSAWPPLAPHIAGGPGNWGMSREGCATQSQLYALEGGVFVLHATAVISEKGIQKMGTTGGMIFEQNGGGCSAVFGPDGRRLTEELPETEEGLVFADLDLDAILMARSLVDACGHYSRPDMLWLGVDDREKLHKRSQDDDTE